MVDFTTLTSNPIITENLKCFVCKNYLSYFPIFLCSNDKSVCGRCTIPEDLTMYRNYAFEKVCQHIKFPCCFKSEGCSEQILPKDIPKHEENCIFREVECVIKKTEKCQWQGSLPDLLKHCEKQHSDLFLKNQEFEMNPTDVKERDNLILFENNLFVFRRKFDPKNKKIKFCLCFSENETNCMVYSCQLSVKNDKTTVSFDFESTEKEFKFSEVSLEALCSYDKPDTFFVKITFPENKNVANVQHIDINSELVKFLKCGSCECIAKPPVFYCTIKSWVICSYCKDDHRSGCAYCKNNPVSDAHFGDILKLVQYPCKYLIEGCTFSSTHDALDDHESSCKYQSSHCPLFSCFWRELLKDLPSHILNAHEDRIGTSEEIYELDSKEMCTSLMRFSRHLFVLLCYFEEKNERWMWTLQKIGNFDTKYKFEIEINDEASGLRILVGKQCSIFTNYYNIFEDDNFCYVRKDQVGFLKEENMSFKFKVRILKM